MGSQIHGQRALGGLLLRAGGASDARTPADGATTGHHRRAAGAGEGIGAHRMCRTSSQQTIAVAVGVGLFGRMLRQNGLG